MITSGSNSRLNTARWIGRDDLNCPKTPTHVLNARTLLQVTALFGTVQWFTYRVRPQQILTPHSALEPGKKQARSSAHILVLLPCISTTWKFVWPSRSRYSWTFLVCINEYVVRGLWWTPSGFRWVSDLSLHPRYCLQYHLKFNYVPLPIAFIRQVRCVQIQLSLCDSLHVHDFIEY